MQTDTADNGCIRFLADGDFTFSMSEKTKFLLTAKLRCCHLDATVGDVIVGLTNEGFLDAETFCRIYDLYTQDVDGDISYGVKYDVRSKTVKEYGWQNGQTIVVIEYTCGRYPALVPIMFPDNNIYYFYYVGGKIYGIYGEHGCDSDGNEVQAKVELKHSNETKKCYFEYLYNPTTSEISLTNEVDIPSKDFEDVEFEDWYCGILKYSLHLKKQFVEEL